MGSCFNDNQSSRQVRFGIEAPYAKPHPNPNQMGRQNVITSGSLFSIIKKNNQSTANYKFNNIFPIYRPILHTNYSKILIMPESNEQMKGQITKIELEYIDIKVPKDLGLRTEYHWIKQNRYLIPQNINNLDKKSIMKRSFQQKYQWFRCKLQQKRVSWLSEKSEELLVDQKNLIMTSNQQFEKINFYKELKIIFLYENHSLDAGGLLRQWMNLSINQIFSSQLALLKLCETVETSYKLCYNEEVKELFIEAAKILGIVIGKAIFQKVPLKCPLNYTILRQICNQPIHINDIYNYDQDFYNGWNYILNNNYISQMQQNFCVYEFDQHGNQLPTLLKQNGDKVIVTSLNKNEFIQLTIGHYCTNAISEVLTMLRNSIYRIIPMNLLEIFQPNELDMIICGRQIIDPVDLKNNTEYINCKDTDGVIIQFWSFVLTLPQHKLSNLLHFVTGTGRVPIKGFKYLESNRGQIKKFTIHKVAYSDKYLLPRSHTCFNRLELPDYPSYQVMTKYVGMVVDNLITSFGLA